MAHRLNISSGGPWESCRVFSCCPGGSYVHVAGQRP
jgi:hypothetical protein